MSLVLKLPTELLSEIAESLVQNKEQAALAALARSIRLFYYIANPLLYRQPFITNFEQIADWVSTLEEWTDELSYDGELRNLPRMSSLFFEGLSGSRPPPPMCCIFCRSDFHESDLHFEHLHLIRRYVDAPFFDHLRALSFVDCEAPNDLLPGLFGPKGRLRSTLRELTLVRTGPHHNANLQFLLHLLHFFPDTRVWANEHWRRMLQDGEVEYMTEEALKAKSLTEFEAFDFLQVGAEEMFSPIPSPPSPNVRLRPTPSQASLPSSSD
ncbi:hypothetical protein BCR35DRAFT_299852 [Leucosporidium creatinivorum]|uniref:F-box domain-containing protein n=1 Tax=Leucosporidium creatinivorum TaxID=106004 RepID=A0A1Y2G0V3_9BASI|nr:hypothetical protein BCR35DRAFT_299852 [Leucosporidium creatinivorum]